MPIGPLPDPIITTKTTTIINNIQAPFLIAQIFFQIGHVQTSSRGQRHGTAKRDNDNMDDLAME